MANKKYDTNVTCKRRKEEHKCVMCGKSDERTLSGRVNCKECAALRRIDEYKRRVSSLKTIVQSWVAVKDGAYPNDCKDIVLVTYSDGTVNALEKSWKEDWLDVFDGVIAWRDLPRPYKEKTT